MCVCVTHVLPLPSSHFRTRSLPSARVFRNHKSINKKQSHSKGTSPAEKQPQQKDMLLTLLSTRQKSRFRLFLNLEGSSPEKSKRGKVLVMFQSGGDSRIVNDNETLRERPWSNAWSHQQHPFR